MKMTNFYVTQRDYNKSTDGPVLITRNDLKKYLESDKKRLRNETYIVYPKSYLITTVGENRIESIPLDHPFDDKTLKMFLRMKEHETLYFIQTNVDDTEYILYEVLIKQEIFKQELKKEFRISICEYDRSKDLQDDIVYYLN